MAHQRVSTTQVQTELPLEAAREATWRAFAELRVQNPVIDVASNVVAGSIGDGIFSIARSAVARFQSEANGTLVSFESNPQVFGVVESKKVRVKVASKLADALEGVLRRGSEAHSNPAPKRAVVVAPLASPFGAPQVVCGEPIYASLRPRKRGVIVIVYGIAGLICCPIASLIALGEGYSALETYRGHEVNDRGVVIAGLILGGLVCAFWAAYIFILVLENL